MKVVVMSGTARAQATQFTAEDLEKVQPVTLNDDKGNAIFTVQMAPVAKVNNFGIDFNAKTDDGYPAVVIEAKNTEELYQKLSKFQNLEADIAGEINSALAAREKFAGCVTTI